MQAGTDLAKIHIYSDVIYLIRTFLTFFPGYLHLMRTSRIVSTDKIN